MRANSFTLTDNVSFYNLLIFFLQSCYGSKEPEKIKKVKDVYIELNLPAVFHAYEEETYNLITRQIQQLSQGLPHELFLTLLHKTYGRKQ